MQTVTGLELNLFERAGYFIRRGLLGPAVVEECLAAAERVVRKYYTGAAIDLLWDESLAAYGVNNLFRPETREPVFARVMDLAEVARAFEDLLGPKTAFLKAALLSRDAFDLRVHRELQEWPLKLSRRPWHRDLVKDLDVPAEPQIVELARWQNHMQLNAALLPDDAFCVVPGTHLAPLTSEQLNALRRDPRSEIAEQVCVRLAPGDAVFYNANLLHRGWIRSGAPRRTLHYAFIGPGYPRESIPPQPWLEDPDFLESLPGRARAFIDRFIASCP